MTENKIRKVEDQNIEITSVDSEGPRNGQDNTYAQQDRLRAESVKRMGITEKCAGSPRKHNTSAKRWQLKKITVIIIKCRM